MATVAVSVKGEIVLPAEMRRKLGIAPGSRVEIELAQDGTALTVRPARQGKASNVAEGRGMIPNQVGYVPVEEMDGARILGDLGGRRPL
jgi:AbrB family looped-hinge helix DNA binding protein